MRLLTIDMKESQQHEINIEGVNGYVLERLVESCYTGQITINITINRQTVQEFTTSVDMLQFKAVLNSCSKFYQSILSPLNCLVIEVIAARHNLTDLKERAHKMILNDFIGVAESEDFYELSKDQLFVLLSNDGLNVPPEESVFLTLHRWINYGVEGRRKIWRVFWDV